MKDKNELKKLRAIIQKIIKEGKEKEVPANPDIEIKPGTAEPLTDPEHELTPDEWQREMPGPAPKAKVDKKYSFSLNEMECSFRLLEERNKMSRLLKPSILKEFYALKNEMSMNIEDPDFAQPHPSVRQGIEGGKETAFTNLGFFSGGREDYKTLEKMGSEEFNRIVNDVKPIGRMSLSEMMQGFGMMAKLEAPHKSALESLALRKVQEQFGLPDSVINKVRAKITNDIVSPENDSDNLMQDVEEDLEFTEEEKEIIRRHVEKRKIQNALMMGAGYRTFTFRNIKEDLDRIDEKLYPLYQKMMPNVSLFMWSQPFEDMMDQASVMGISKLTRDENNKVKAEAKAVVFPILIHEVAKAAIELLFANYLIGLTQQYGKNVAAEVIKQSDVYREEIWMKRIGPTLWKYLHDIIDYIIIHEKGGDYKIVAYLLNKISHMEPEEFVEFMNNVVYDGNVATEKIEQMIHEIEQKIAAYQQQQDKVPSPKEVETGKDVDTSSISDELQKLSDEAKIKLTNEPETTIDYEVMSPKQLQQLIEKAIEDENYEEAAKIAKFLNK